MNALFYGAIAEIKKMTGYSRSTISDALNNNTTGKKAARVREIYNKKYQRIFNYKTNRKNENDDRTRVPRLCNERVHSNE